MRLLLVEDETRLSEALAYILKKHKYGADTAFDGITGQEMAETGIYDIIILDRMLPGKERRCMWAFINYRDLEIPFQVFVIMQTMCQGTVPCHV